MKRAFCFFLFVFVFLTVSEAQKFKGSLALGVDLTQVDGDQVYGYKKVGLNGGAGVILPFNFNKKKDYKPWALSFEILFTQKGSMQRSSLGQTFCDTCQPGVKCNPDIKYKLALNYLSLPLMVNYTDKKTGWSFGMGIAFNRLFGISEIENGVNTSVFLRDGVYKTEDYTVLLDVRFPIYNRLKFNFRYEYSMFPIRKRIFYKKDGILVDPYERQQYNNVLTFRLVYVINEDLDITKRKNQKQF